MTDAKHPLTLTPEEMNLIVSALRDKGHEAVDLSFKLIRGMKNSNILDVQDVEGGSPNWIDREEMLAAVGGSMYRLIPLEE